MWGRHRSADAALFRVNDSTGVQLVVGYGTTTTRFEPATVIDSSGKEIRETSQSIDKTDSETRYRGTWEPMETKTMDETSGRKSILVPNSIPRKQAKWTQLIPPEDDSGVQDVAANCRFKDCR